MADHYGSSDYSGFVGQLGLVFEDQTAFAGLTSVPEGTFIGDVADIYAGQYGLTVFCIDSETLFQGSGTNTPQTYAAHSYQQAEVRYTLEGVSGYTAGGLRRAAYLLESFYWDAMDGGDLGASTLQSALWEVLTDTVPSLSFGQGNYYLRNNTSNTTFNNRANQMLVLSSSWFAQAEAEDWGGSNYDPGDRVVFWLDPNSVFSNQSVISLNPILQGQPLLSVPEPSSSLLVLLGAFSSLIGFRRRTKQTRSQAGKL